MPYGKVSYVIVYLIHFAKPLGHARHYIGTTRVYRSRMRAHRKGQGAAILRACKTQGINWRVVRKWFGSRKLERRLKARKSAASLCPVCSRRRCADNKRTRQARQNMVSKRKTDIEWSERRKSEIKSLQIINTVVCPTCGAAKGKSCVTVRGINNQPTSIHTRRKQAASSASSQVRDKHDQKDTASTETA
jgi:predicted GIY-YIG superfamily endonuclease/ribosomal protein L32